MRGCSVRTKIERLDVIGGMLGIVWEHKGLLCLIYGQSKWIVHVFGIAWEHKYSLCLIPGQLKWIVRVFRNSVGVQRFSILDLQPIEVDCSCSSWCWFCGLFFLMPCLPHKRQKSRPHLISTRQSNWTRGNTVQRHLKALRRSFQTYCTS